MGGSTEGPDPDGFDAKASTWDDAPHRRERARVAADLIAARLPLGPETRVLDYGSGTGLLAEQLRDRVGSLVLAEPSAGMRQVLEAKIADGVLAGAEVLDIDLSASGPPDDLRCDVIVSLMVVHHLRDIPAALARMRGVLDPGGHLCIIDLEEEDGSFHSAGFSGHNGISRDLLSRALVSAGMSPPTFEHAFTMSKKGRDYELFLATSVAV